MLTKLIRLVIITALLSAQISGQEIKSEQKNALIKEIFALSNKTFEADPPFPAGKFLEIVWKSYSEDPAFERLNAKQRKRLKEQIDQSSIRIGKRLEELLEQKLTQTYYLTYDKAFDENELKQLVDFLKSPLGKKFTEYKPGKSAPLTKAESEGILEFLKSPTGKKLLVVGASLLNVLKLRTNEFALVTAREIADEEMKLFLEKEK